MKQLSVRKQQQVIRLFFRGEPYEAIAIEAGISKGSVANIIRDLKEGRLTQLSGLEEEIDALRELAVELKQERLSPSHANVGLSAYRGIVELGVEPRDITGLVSQFRHMKPTDIVTRDFVSAARALMDVEARTGGPEELETLIRGLEGQANGLETRLEELEPAVVQMEAEMKGRESSVLELDVQKRLMEGEATRLQQAVGDRQDQLKALEGQIQETQRIVGDLCRRSLDRDEELQQAERQLAEKRENLDRLAAVGLPHHGLREFAAPLEVAAQFYKVEPQRFLGWFLSRLEEVSSLLGLESLIKSKSELLARADRDRLAAEKRQDALTSELQATSRQITQQKAIMRSIRKGWEAEVATMSRVMGDGMKEGAEELAELATSVHEEVRSRMLELAKLGESIGRLDEALDSYAMVRPLTALLQGKDGVGPRETRVVATALCWG